MANPRVKTDEAVYTIADLAPVGIFLILSIILFKYIFS